MIVCLRSDLREAGLWTVRSVSHVSRHGDCCKS